MNNLQSKPQLTLAFYDGSYQVSRKELDHYTSDLVIDGLQKLQAYRPSNYWAELIDGTDSEYINKHRRYKIKDGDVVIYKDFTSIKRK